MCSIDWGVVLDFVKALVPIAAIAVGSFVAVRTYASQKMLDRRIDWYVRTYQQMGSMATAFRMAAQATPTERKEKHRIAREELQRLSDLASEGPLFAGVETREALATLHGALKEALAQMGSAIDSALAESVTQSMLPTRAAMAKEMRKKFHLDDARRRHWLLFWKR